MEKIAEVKTSDVAKKNLFQGKPEIVSEENKTTIFSEEK